MSAKTKSEVRPSFSWKEAIIGGLITLVVTTVAGVSVWLITRTPNHDERLIYKVETPSHFAKSGRGVGFHALSVRSDGALKSENVTVDIVVPAGLKVIDRSVVFSSGKSVPYKFIDRGAEFSVYIPDLLPGDRATISLLSSGIAGRNISFSVRSKQMIGVKEEVEGIGGGRGVSLKTLVITLIVAALLQFVGFQLISYRRFRNKRQEFIEHMKSIGAFSANRNNVGFLLLHNEALEKAEEVIWEDIKSGEAEQITMGHYATILALQGSAEYQKYLAAAEWPGADDHTVANVLLNRFIIAADSGDVELARKMASESIEIGPGVRPYFKSSALLKRVIKKAGMEDFIEAELRKYSS